MNEYENGMEDTESKIDILVILSDIWKGVKKLGWLVIVLGVITAGINCIHSYNGYRPHYTASVTFTVNLRQNSDGSIYDDKVRASQMSKTFPFILSSGVLRNIIAEDLGAENVTETITAENVVDTNLFTIKVTSWEAQRAYDVLQSVIKNYPKVAESVMGSTYLTLLEETGVPSEAANSLNYIGSIKIGFIPGAILGIIIIMIYALTRKTIHSVEDITEITNMKYLGRLPAVTHKKRGLTDENIISLKDEKLPQLFRDELYKIRTRIEKAAGIKKMKTIMVTSAVPGEGKSTLAFNLAMALAETNKKVVLVDCDLRRPSLNRMMDIKPDTASLNEVLRDEAELESALRYYEELNVYVLACSKPVSDSSEALGMPKIHEILKKLSETMDYVIIDTAPSALISDTSDLAKFVDGAIYTIRFDFAKVNHILEGIEHLTESSNIELIGFIMNYVKTGLTGYGYSGYGSYGKHGYYGYGRKKPDNEEFTTQ